MPGNGSTSLLQTSLSSASSLARSPRGGASTGSREVVSSDCERLIDVVAAVDGDDELLDESFSTHVFLRITWQRGDFGPTVVAR